MEIRTLEGGPADLARLCESVWREEFLGRDLVPIWDEAFFDWQLFAGRTDRGYHLAAYDGTRLVGALLAEPFDFRVAGPGGVRRLAGSTGSWLTVEPEARPLGVGLALIEALRERHRERGAAFCLGYVFGEGTSDAHRFWSAYRTAFPDAIQDLGLVGCWIRLIDARAMREWSLTARDRWLVRALGLLTRTPPAPPEVAGGVRAYRPEDLPACLALLHAIVDRADLGIVWTAERLALQLDHRGLPSTWVLEREGAVAGFLNWYPFGALGKRLVRFGVIDLLAIDGLTAREARDLLSAALSEMRSRGCALSVTLRLPSTPVRPLLSTGFVPPPGGTRLLAVMADPAADLRGVRRLHVHFR